MQDQGRSGGTPPEQAATPEGDGRLTLTVREAAKLLGISPYTAYEAAHRGELPVRFIGRRMLVPRAALLRLLDEQQ
jgi:excisionase family DNA binding protein